MSKQQAHVNFMCTFNFTNNALAQFWLNIFNLVIKVKDVSSLKPCALQRAYLNYRVSGTLVKAYSGKKS